MKLALLSPLPPERTGIADYAAHWRDALAATGVSVQAPLGQLPAFDSERQARQWVQSQDWSGVDVVHAELGGGRQREYLALRALQAWRRAQGARAGAGSVRGAAGAAAWPALSATVHDPERLVWRPMHAVGLALERSRAPRAVRQAAALLTDPWSLRDERRVAGGLDGCVTLTATGARALSRRLRLPTERISVIPHGTLSLAAAELPALPPQGPLRLVYFGFIYAGKGIEDLLDALALLLRRQPGWVARMRLTLAGGTEPDIAFGGHRSYLQALRERVHALGLSTLVDWALDVDEAAVPALLQAHHAVVLPYRESRKLAWLGQMRGTSGALAWAIACGRGAITSDARAFAEEIASGNGAAFPQGDVPALARRIESLLEQPRQLRDWADRARELAAQRSWPHTARRFRAHLEAACAHAAARRAGNPMAVQPVEMP